MDSNVVIPCSPKSVDCVFLAVLSNIEIVIYGYLDSLLNIHDSESKEKRAYFAEMLLQANRQDISGYLIIL